MNTELQKSTAELQSLVGKERGVDKVMVSREATGSGMDPEKEPTRLASQCTGMEIQRTREHPRLLNSWWRMGRMETGRTAAGSLNVLFGTCQLCNGYRIPRAGDKKAVLGFFPAKPTHSGL